MHMLVIITSLNKNVIQKTVSQAHGRWRSVSAKPYKRPNPCCFSMNRSKRISTSIFGVSSIFVLLLLVSTTTSMTLALAQTTSPQPPSTSSGGSSNNNTNASASTNVKSNPANQLKTKVVPRLLEKMSSLSNIVAASTVKGIKFSGISIGDDNLTVTLKRQTNESNTGAAATTANMTEMSQPVTIIVSKLPVHNLTEVMSMLESTRNMEGGVSSMNPSSPSTIDLGTLLTSNPTVQGDLLRTLSILKNVQIGLGAIVKPNWTIPQTITLRLIGLPVSQVASTLDTTDVILVTVVPYRGLLGIAASTR
jgi:hypothetical protein